MAVPMHIAATHAPAPSVHAEKPIAAAPKEPVVGMNSGVPHGEAAGKDKAGTTSETAPQSIQQLEATAAHEPAAAIEGASAGKLQALFEKANTKYESMGALGQMGVQTLTSTGTQIGGQYVMKGVTGLFTHGGGSAQTAASGAASNAASSAVVPAAARALTPTEQNYVASQALLRQIEASNLGNQSTQA